MTGHVHESWMIRRAADGGRYCAACGYHFPTVTPEPKKETT